MNKHTQEVIAGYLAELLTDEQGALIQTATQDVLMQKATQSVLGQTATDVLEQAKKDQLQALLNSQFALQVPTEIDIPVEIPAPPIQSEVELKAEPVEINDWETEVEADISAPSVDDPQDLVGELAKPKIEAEWAANGRPKWAQTQFDVLLFQVAGLTLAVPLIALGQIHPLTAKLTPVFGQAAWFLGLQPTHQGLVRTVNTALFVMPEKYDAACLAEAKYLMTIDGMDWGLVVDNVRHPTALQPEDVTWRGQRSKRPWLAGTVKSAMCALLDIPQIGVMLSEASH